MTHNVFFLNFQSEVLVLEGTHHPTTTTHPAPCSLAAPPMVGQLLAALPDRPALLDDLLPRLTGHGALVHELARALVPSPPTERSSGGFIASGYDDALDSLRETSGNARKAIAALEARYRDETGVSALKIKHNGVLGYFIEVPSKHADRLMAPDSGFTHRQTMASAVRFNSVHLHEEATRIAEAGGRALGRSRISYVETE